MVNVHNLTVTFNGSDLFSGITFKLEKGDRVGLVGKNGAGKSTMLKVLAKDQAPDGGTMAFDKEAKIGFLRQDIDFVPGRTILNEAYQAFEEIKKLENEIQQLNQQLSDTTDFESEPYHQILLALDEKTTRFELLGGYTYQGDTEKILLGLGFQRADFEKLTDTFSGGWRMRIELAKLLLQQNDVLLLDEPTNHLDIESIIWLEQFLKNYPGVVVLVSHDKMFLDNVTNRTIEISLGRIYDYKKSYSDFLKLRAELIENQIQAQKNQEKEIKAKEQLIEKFRYKATKASMAQSLIKQLDKIERIAVDVEDTAVMHVKFPLCFEPGKVVVATENLTKKYDDKLILSEVNLAIERGEKVAFVGQNGQGKSTLAKIMVGATTHQGLLQLGYNVKIGYFAQNQAEHLDGEITLLETMENAATEHNRTKVRDMLGAFLFKGDDVEKKVKVLSGGERNRLALCKLLLEPFNVLVMDEPTNHLDIASKNVLKKAIIDFEGTLILVSHDRDFLKGLTQKVFYFKDHVVKEYLGDVDDFLEMVQMDNLRTAELKTVNKETITDKKSTNQLSRDREKEIKKLQNKINKIEKDIDALENKLASMDDQLANEYEKYGNDASFYADYQQKKDAIAALMDEWEVIEQNIADLKR